VNWAGALIVAGYAALIVTTGWLGLVAAGAHVAVLLLCVPRK
jgi:hypothetical protein